MSKVLKTLNRILLGRADANIGFDDLCNLLRHLGFVERIRGSHHIFSRDGIVEIFNLQSKAGKAKAYQVRQIRSAIIAHALAGDRESEPPAAEESARGEESGPATTEDKNGE